MNYRLYFAVPTFSLDESDGFPMTDNYDYWIPLMEYFLKGSDTIEIHSWYDEKQVIEEIIYLSNLTEKPTEHKLINESHLSLSLIYLNRIFRISSYTCTKSLRSGSISQRNISTSRLIMGYLIWS